MWFAGGANYSRAKYENPGDVMKPALNRQMQFIKRQAESTYP